VALDGSEIAERALDFAVDLAQKHSSEVQLLTVVPPIFLPVYSFNIMKSEAISDAAKQLENSFRGVLSKAEEQVRKANLKVSTNLEHGSPDEKIIETAKHGSFDIIVMGSRGLGHRGNGLGSVSSGVADNATCAVLIVK